MIDARPKGDWNAEAYGRHAHFVPELGRPVLAWLAPAPGERILDLGCGDGRLTAEIAETGARVIGIDASPAQVEAARARGLDARVMDAAALPFQAAFEAVFSNAALHWMIDMDAVMACVARALVRGGRFVGELGGAGNVAAILDALLAELEERGIDGRPVVPWVFPAPDAYRARLAAAGFTVRRMEHFERPTELDCAMTDWLGIFAPAFAALLPEDEQRPFFAAVSKRLEGVLFDAVRGVWRVDYVRLRFEAVLP